MPVPVPVLEMRVNSNHLERERLQLVQLDTGRWVEVDLVSWRRIRTRKRVVAGMVIGTVSGRHNKVEGEKNRLM